MPMTEKPITHRRELVYFMDEDMALQLRDFVMSYLGLEIHSLVHPDYAYPMHTLFLDSVDRELYWQAVEAPERRRQLRIRYYSGKPTSPVYLETKHWRADHIDKTRASLERRAVARLLEGQSPDPSSLISKGGQGEAALEQFMELQEMLNARPVMHVAMQRECYTDQGESIFVSMDREMTGELWERDGFPMSVAKARRLIDCEVMLKLRFENRWPEWLREMVEIFSLEAQEYDAYLYGLSKVDQVRAR